MKDYRTVAIDLDIHKAIEAERTSFAETRNDILRRLLGLPAMADHRKADNDGIQHDVPGPGCWSGKGAILPAGTDLRMAYNGETYIAVIDDGSWLIDGERHSSPSGAASAVARTRSGNRVNLDGWEYWHYRIPGTDEWRSLKSLKESKRA